LRQRKRQPDSSKKSNMKKSGPGVLGDVGKLGQPVKAAPERRVSLLQVGKYLGEPSEVKLGEGGGPCSNQLGLAFKRQNRRRKGGDVRLPLTYRLKRLCG